ncbi:MAG: hypothetical protein KatS3mg065_0030 [Chloroflexota bacterium]|nr:MAG: hypothetical protein KatS3mg065_0030 [Chloroflexota bacterium]
MAWTVPLEVHLTTEHADVGSLERTMAVALAEVGRTLWRELLRRLEADLVAPAACPACGGRMKANGRAPRRLLSLAGEIELRRRRVERLQPPPTPSGSPSGDPSGAPDRGPGRG